MLDRSVPLPSFPSRPFELDEIDELEENDRFVSILYDSEMVEIDGPYAFAYNLVLITKNKVSSAVYIDEEETWYRVYGEPRTDAVLEAAYDAIREVRDEESLFSRAPLTLEEAVFMADVFSHEDDAEPEYEEGDEFECPVCEQVHIVKFHEDEYEAEIEDIDASYLYVDCTKAHNDQLIIRFHAKSHR